MGLLNCWNWKNCGRHPGGEKVSELGVCPAAIDNKGDGFLGGRCAGRACIYIAGTLCGGDIQGTYISKQANCTQCDYYKALKREYGASMSSMQYNEYKSLPDSHKKRTNKNQKWAANNLSGEDIAKMAKEKYSR